MVGRPKAKKSGITIAFKAIPNEKNIIARKTTHKKVPTLSQVLLPSDLNKDLLSKQIPTIITGTPKTRTKGSNNKASKNQPS